MTGTWMQVLGINWLVLSATGSATKMGAAVLVQALPVLVLAPFGGALADRLPARPLLVATQSANALLALTLAVCTFADIGGMGLVYAIVFASGLVSAVDGPVMGRFGSTVVPAELLGNALALGSMVNSAGRILGMSLGGVLVATLGPGMLFGLNALSFLGVIGTLFLLRLNALTKLVTLETPAHPVKENALQSVRSGLRYVRTEPCVMLAFGLAFVLGSLGRNYQVTMGAMTAGPLGAGAGGYGLLSTIFAIGAVLGALAATTRRDMSYKFLAGVGLAGSLLQALSGFMPGLWTFGAMILFIAATAVIIDTVVSTRVQLDTRGDMRGRVLALLTVTGSMAGAAGAPLLGWMAESFGARAGLITAGVLCAAACLAALAMLRRVPEACPMPSERVPASMADVFEPAADAVLAADPIGGPRARAGGELEYPETSHAGGRVLVVR